MGGDMASTGRAKRHRRRWIWAPVGLIAIPLLAINVSPRLGAALIRYVFGRGAANTKKALEKHAPAGGVAVIANQAYRPHDKDSRLDVYFPDTLNEGETLPTLIWTHGGAWISGDKTNTTPYFQLIANEGFTVISLNYSLGPHRSYPTAVHQLNDAHAYILANADRFHVDSRQLFLAGDSAGAQLTSQMAAIATNPDFAAGIGVEPALQPEQIRGLLLNCGIYVMSAFVNTTGVPETTLAELLVWGTQTSLWAYTGHRNTDTAAIRQMSTIEHVTANYPPVWISGGNGDPLTDKQSRPFAAKLQSLGVEVTTLFYEKDHEPKLGHEYQFILDNEDGMNALTSMIEFMRAKSTTGPNPSVS